MQKEEVGPFVKWAGGKTQLLTSITNLMPKEFNTYYEPFVGGGAVFFHLMPSRAVINDYNKELINAYITLRDNYIEVKKILKKHQTNNSKEYFYKIRALDRNENFNKLSNAERAARFIYLNKAGFNGLYRVNKKGQMNVPFAQKKNVNLISPKLENTIGYLNNKQISIKNMDFEDAVKDTKIADFVYFDPPYIPLKEGSDFTSYTEIGFDLSDQVRLKDVAIELTKKGVWVMLSNSDTQLTRELYSNPCFTIHTVSARRSINSKGNKRGQIRELLITNY